MPLQGDPVAFVRSLGEQVVPRISQLWPHNRPCCERVGSEAQGDERWCGTLAHRQFW